MFKMLIEFREIIEVHQWLNNVDDNRELLEYVDKKYKEEVNIFAAKDFNNVKTALINRSIEIEVVKDLKLKSKEKVLSHLKIMQMKASEQLATWRDNNITLESMLPRLSKDLKLEVGELEYLNLLDSENKDLVCFEFSKEVIEDFSLNVKETNLTILYVIDMYSVYFENILGSKNKAIYTTALNTINGFKPNLIKDTENLNSEVTGVSMKTYNEIIGALDTLGLEELCKLNVVNRVKVGKMFDLLIEVTENLLEVKDEVGKLYSLFDNIGKRNSILEIDRMNRISTNFSININKLLNLVEKVKG